MIIRVLPELESREQWIAFCRREQPYCLIERPACLVDFQTSFLQLTLFAPATANAAPDVTRDPVRYSLGSRHSMQPAWELIKGCQWSLHQLLDGLEQLDFDSNVRDNALLQLHGDLSVRKRFVHEPRLVAPAASGLLAPLTQLPDSLTHDELCRLLANQQWHSWRDLGANRASPQALLLSLQQQPAAWNLLHQGARLVLLYCGQPLASFIPDLTPPQPRLAGRG